MKPICLFVVAALTIVGCLADDGAQWQANRDKIFSSSVHLKPEETLETLKQLLASPIDSEEFHKLKLMVEVAILDDAKCDRTAFSRFNELTEYFHPAESSSAKLYLNYYKAKQIEVCKPKIDESLSVLDTRLASERKLLDEIYGHYDATKSECELDARFGIECSSGYYITRGAGRYFYLQFPDDLKAIGKLGNRKGKPEVVNFLREHLVRPCQRIVEATNPFTFLYQLGLFSVSQEGVDNWLSRRNFCYTVRSHEGELYDYASKFVIREFGSALSRAKVMIS